MTSKGITKGIKNALARRDHHSMCADCGFALPKYPGRYPGKCPCCGEKLGQAEAVVAPVGTKIQEAPL